MTELSPKEQDIKNLIIAQCQVGARRLTKQMKRYVYKSRQDGVYLFDVIKMYEKIQVAARMIASISDPESIVAVSGRLAGQRAVYKFGQYTKCQSVTGRWSPGMLTNQITKKFIEPRLLIVCDPRVDYNALLESSYVNIPVIALCNTDNNLNYVDCAIPCNNRGKKCLAMIWYLLTKAVLDIKGEKNGEFADVLPGAFMYRNVDVEPKEEDNKQEEAPAEEENKDAGEEDVDDDEQFID